MYVTKEALFVALCAREIIQYSCADKSLEEFLDDQGLDNPNGEHRKSSPEAYIEWGRRRSIDILNTAVNTMNFEGRTDAVRGLLNHVCMTIVSTYERHPIFFVHASPGVGKTRIFTEIVKMGTEKQKSILFGVGDAERKSAQLENILHIVISFNSTTRYKAEQDAVADESDSLFQILLRILHMWLTVESSIQRVFIKIKACVTSGRLPVQFLTFDEVLSLVSQRSQRKYINLLVDELLKITNDILLNDIVKSLAAEQDIQYRPFNLRVCFSSLKVGVFKLAETDSGRKVTSIPLPLLGASDTRSVIAISSREKRADFLRGRSDVTDDLLIDMIMLLSGGHMRACETLIRELHNVTNSSTLGEYVKAACNSYGQTYNPNILGAVVLCLLGVSVRSNTVVRVANGIYATVSDLVASGQLMASINEVEENAFVSPNMPLISFIQWTFKTNDEYYKAEEMGMEGTGYEIAIPMTTLLNRLIEPGSMSGKSFESVCILRHIIMRSVYFHLTQGVVGVAHVDWRNAALSDYFRHTRRKGPISAKLAALRFDFTKLLSYSWDVLADNEIEAFLRKNYDEKLSRICQPQRVNFESIDYFYSLVSTCGEVVTVVVQVRWSSALSGTKVSIGDIDVLLKRAIEKTVSYGVPEDSIFCVAELWRDAPERGAVNEPLQIENAIVQTLPELRKQAGKLFADLIAFVDLKK